MISPQIYRRPRLLNLLHSWGLISPFTQMNDEELECLERYAKDRHVAVEIGTMMGVSASVIARALNPSGKLFCVDPWEKDGDKENPCWSVCYREIQKKGLLPRVVFLRGFSHEMEKMMPAQCDFIFVDGDHSYDGIKTDWGIVTRKLSIGGVVALHDTTVPQAEPHRHYGSVTYFDEVIRHHPQFDWIECCYSMNILQRVS